MPRMMGGYDPCLDDYAKTFYNRADVQEALHVSDGQQLKNWSICKYVIETNGILGVKFLMCININKVVINTAIQYSKTGRIQSLRLFPYTRS